MVSRSASRCVSQRPTARGGCGRGVLVGTVSSTLGSLLLELCLLGRERRDLRGASFSGAGPVIRRSRGHGHLVLRSHRSPPRHSHVEFQRSSPGSGQTRARLVVAGQCAGESGCVRRWRSSRGGTVAHDACGVRRIIVSWVWPGMREALAVATEDPAMVAAAGDEQDGRDCCPLGPMGGAPCDVPVGAIRLYCGGHGRRLSALLPEPSPRSEKSWAL